MSFVSEILVPQILQKFYRIRQEIARVDIESAVLLVWDFRDFFACFFAEFFDNIGKSDAIAVSEFDFVFCAKSLNRAVRIVVRVGSWSE